MFIINRRKKRLILFFLVNISLVITAIILVFFGKSVSGTAIAKITDCPAHILFGVYCPFCGGTRSMDALMRGDIISSLIYFPAMIPAIIIFAVYDILSFKRILRDEEKIIKIHRAVWIPLVVLVLVNWIFRNTALLIFDFDYISML